MKFVNFVYHGNHFEARTEMNFGLLLCLSLLFISHAPPIRFVYFGRRLDGVWTSSIHWFLVDDRPPEPMSRLELDDPSRQKSINTGRVQCAPNFDSGRNAVTSKAAKFIQNIYLVYSRSLLLLIVNFNHEVSDLMDLLNKI